MKRTILFLIIGMIAVIIGSFMKMNGELDFANLLILIGLLIEVAAVIIVIKYFLNKTKK